MLRRNPITLKTIGVAAAAVLLLLLLSLHGPRIVAVTAIAEGGGTLGETISCLMLIHILDI